MWWQIKCQFLFYLQVKMKCKYQLLLFVFFDNICSFHKVTYLIGRSVEKVDYVIDSSTYTQSACISRCHARVVRQEGNKHRVFDDSLNGVFINNIKISGQSIFCFRVIILGSYVCSAKWNFRVWCWNIIINETLLKTVFFVVKNKLYKEQ